MESQQILIEPYDLQQLRMAKQLLEKPGVAAQVATKIGKPLEKSLNILPPALHESLQKAGEKSLHMAYDIAARTLPHDSENRGRISQNRTHKALAAGTGAIGGFLGPVSLVAELPLSTTLIMRSIIDIALSEGENIESLETKLACLEVFAFGGRSSSDDSAGSGYFMTRAALAQTFTEAAKSLATRTASKEVSSVLAKYIAKVAARFQIMLTQKAAAQVMPVIGAVGGATINTIFMNHFQNMARGHFVVRRLEKKYGLQIIEKAYLQA